VRGAWGGPLLLGGGRQKSPNWFVREVRPSWSTKGGSRPLLGSGLKRCPILKRADGAESHNKPSPSDPFIIEIHRCTC